jgi:hypothetical protein
VNAESFAELLGARRVGGRWLAKCPAHPDQHPSLSIAQGDKCVLIVCRSAGCAPRAIVAACGLSMKDLFDDVAATPAKRSAMSATRQKMRAKRQADRLARDRAFRLERLLDAIGARMAIHPDDAEVARLFHDICERLRDIQTSICAGDAPLRMQPPRAIGSETARTLSELGRNFDA